MSTLGIITGVVVAQSGVTLMGRILGQNGEPVTQATLSAIAYTVRDLTDGTTTVSSTALTVSEVIYDDLQTADPRWTRDSESHPGPDDAWGYNFLATLPAGLFDDYDQDEDTAEVTPHAYQVSVRFTPVTGQPFVAPFRFTPAPAW
jgi:hypothetical protein